MDTNTYLNLIDLEHFYDRLHKAVAWNHGRNMYGLNLDYRGSGCRIIIKAFTEGRAEICFINASTSERCLEVLEAFLHTTSKTGVEWRPDKYYREG